MRHRTSPAPPLAATAVLLALTLAGCTAPPEEAIAPTSAPFLEGRVLDTTTGAPVAEALVYVRVADLALPVNTTTPVQLGRAATAVPTDADGRFVLDALGVGPHPLDVRPAGASYLPTDCGTVQVPEGGTTGVTCLVAPWPEGLTFTAHRGASAAAPENTLASIRKAGLMGAPRVEFDVQLSIDGVVFLLHDDTLDRTTSGSGVAWQHTMAELAALDAGSWFDASFAEERVPTLAQALAEVQAHGMVAVIEAKQSDPPFTDPRMELVPAIAAEVRALGMQEQAVVISFDASYTGQCLHEGDLRCGHIEGRDDAATALAVPRLAGLAGSHEYHLCRCAATQQHVADARAGGLHVAVWTVNDPEEAVALRERGVDSLTTDVPDAVMAAFAAAPAPAQGS